MKTKQLTLSHVEGRKQERERERERGGLLKGFTPTLNKTDTRKNIKRALSYKVMSAS